jgi:hypothetical protein
MKEDRTATEPEGPDEAALADLVARHYAAQAGEVCKDRDAHWRVMERWSYGEHAGWFVEHDGYLYELPDGDYGEEGPFASREAALARMAEHLRTATARLDGRG